MLAAAATVLLVACGDTDAGDEPSAAGEAAATAAGATPGSDPAATAAPSRQRRPSVAAR